MFSLIFLFTNKFQETFLFLFVCVGLRSIVAMLLLLLLLFCNVKLATSSEEESRKECASDADHHSARPFRELPLDVDQVF